MDIISRVDNLNIKATNLWQKSSTMTRVALAIAAVVSAILLSPILIPVGIGYAFGKAFVVTPKEVKKGLESAKEAIESPEIALAEPKKVETVVEPEKIETAQTPAVEPSKKGFPWGTVLKVAGIAVGIGLLAWGSYQAYQYFFPAIASCAAPMRDPLNGVFTGWERPFFADGKVPQTVCDLKDRIAKGDINSFRSMGGHDLMYCREYSYGERPPQHYSCSIKDAIADPRTGEWKERWGGAKFFYHPTSQKEAGDMRYIYNGNEFCRGEKVSSRIKCSNFLSQQLEKARNFCAETLPSYFECMGNAASKAKKEFLRGGYERQTAAPTIPNGTLEKALEFFGFSPNTKPTLEEVNKRSRQLFLKFHPDRNPNNPEAAEKAVLVNVFKEALKAAFS